MTDPLSANCFFDLTDFEYPDLFNEGFVWEALEKLGSFMDDAEYPDIPGGMALDRPLDRTLVFHEGEYRDGNPLKIVYGTPGKGGLAVYDREMKLNGASVIMAGAVLKGGRFRMGKGVLIESGAFVCGPVILGDFSEVRQGAYLRGNCLTGRGCVIGHVTEVKNTIFLNGAKAGHFAYLGDSILGNRVNLGAGTKMANMRFIKGNISIRTPDGLVDTGLGKLGAILGDEVQTGCNSVTNPGTIIGRRSFLLPNTTAPSGYHPDCTMIRG